MKGEIVITHVPKLLLDLKGGTYTSTDDGYLRGYRDALDNIGGSLSAREDLDKIRKLVNEGWDVRIKPDVLTQDPTDV